MRQLLDERVLLDEDTFTSGARVQSAASAFNNAGAITQRWRSFNFATCCLGPMF